MKTQISFSTIVSVLITLIISWSSATADDINPPTYRGAPLSVHAHWVSDATGALALDDFSWVDDSDPTTFLSQFLPDVLIDPTSGGYDFRIPNFVDDLPLKLLRLQLTWQGTTQPPIIVDALGYDNNQPVPGAISFASSPLVFTQPDGGYQYFDFEFKPNPDYESLHVNLAPDAHLVQVVVDSVSTIPEPATMLLLGVGGFVLRRRK